MLKLFNLTLILPEKPQIYKTKFCPDKLPAE